MKRLAVTGTKGKTTVVRLINQILLSLQYSTLSVDSEYVVVNGEKVFDAEYSKKVYGLLPGRAPGRFSYLVYNAQKQEWECDFMVLEALIGCRTAWLGYDYHRVGIFTNIFEDHIGSEALQNQEDLANAKWGFISRVSTKGDEPSALICNYDDFYIRQLAENAEKKKNIIKYVTTNKDSFDMWEEGVYLDHQNIIFKYFLGWESITKVFNLKNNIPSFQWLYLPTVRNMAFALYGILFLIGAEKFTESFEYMTQFLDQYIFPLEGGRMINIERKWRKIIVDYAHEKESLSSLLSFAQSLKEKSDAQLTAVVRLAPDRVDPVYRETWEKLSPLADKFIVYDKIDGIDRLEYHQVMGIRFHRLPWDVMKMFAQALRSQNNNVKEIIYRKDAMDHAIETSNPWDVIVIIVNDFEKTAQFLRDKLELKI